MSKCKSILRWVGSKKRIINEIIENLPEEMNDYYEPFLGSGVVYLFYAVLVGIINSHWNYI